MKRISWALMGLLTLAAALRLVNLSDRPLWYDEAFAVLYASQSMSEILYGTLARVQGAAADVHPVLYYFALHGWMQLVGQTPLVVRMPSVLLGLGTVVAAWGLARELFDERVAVWAAAFTAASPFLIAYSQEARMYALLGFCSAALLWAFARAARTGSLRAWIAFVILGTLTLYSHNLGFLTFVALGVFVVARALSGPPHWALVVKTTLAGLIMAILWSPWLALVPSQFGKIEQAYWVTRPDLKTLVQTLIVFSFDFENAIFPRGLIAPALFGAVLLLVVVIVQLVRALSQARHRAHEGAPAHFGVWLLATLAFAPLLMLFLVSQWRPVYVIRGLLPAAICYLILAAWAVTQMPRVARYTLSAILAGLVIATMASYYGYQDFPRGPFAQLDAMLHEKTEPGDVIIHDNKLSFFPAYYYDRSLPQSFVRDAPGSGEDTLAYPTQQALGLYATTLDAATSGARRVWVVMYEQAIAEYKAVGREHPDLSWMDARFRCVEVIALGNLRVYRYERAGE
jgi:mannosyltransferase